MKILYGAPASVFVRKPRILLREKGVDFHCEPTNPMLEVSHEFKAISPLLKIPAFKENDFHIADSSAICAYIDAKYPFPSFYPKKPEELAQALWFEEYADTVLFSAIAPCYYQTVLVPLYRNREPDELAIENALTKNLPTVAAYLENCIKGKQYFVGNQFSIADIAIVSIFFNMVFSGYPLPEDKWPHLSAYLNRHFQRESFKECIVDVVQELTRASHSKASLI